MGPTNSVHSINGWFYWEDCEGWILGDEWRAYIHTYMYIHDHSPPRQWLTSFRKIQHYPSQTDRFLYVNIYRLYAVYKKILVVNCMTDVHKYISIDFTTCTPHGLTSHWQYSTDNRETRREIISLARTASKQECIIKKTNLEKSGIACVDGLVSRLKLQAIKGLQGSGDPNISSYHSFFLHLNSQKHWPLPWMMSRSCGI